MKTRLSRRRAMQAIGLSALPPLKAQQTPRPGMRGEGPGTPKLCMIVSDAAINDAGMRRIKQLGVDHVLMTGPAIP